MKCLEIVCRNLYVCYIVYLIGCIIGCRKGYKVNIEKLMNLVEEINIILEINVNLYCLDLNVEIVCKYLKVKLIINMDVYYINYFDFMKYGVVIV